MNKIIVLTGSARPNSAGKTVADLAQKEVEKHEGFTATIVNPGDLNLPFFNAPSSPSADNFEATDPAVKAWTEQVANADGFVFVMPEYNHNLSAVQKNALDWVYAEWNDKPIAQVYYNWYEKSNAQVGAEMLFGVIKARALPTITKLQFGKDIDGEGNFVDGVSVQTKITATVDELVKDLVS